MKYILVHGTFDTDSTDEGEKWWQTQSLLYQKLSNAAQKTDTIETFRWSGENSHVDRVAAAKRLARKLRREADADGVTIIAHSHGGNVADYALNRLLPWQKKHVSVVTIGTPFLSVATSFFQRYSLLERILIFPLSMLYAYAVYSFGVFGLFGSDPVIDFFQPLFDFLERVEPVPGLEVDLLSLLTFLMFVILLKPIWLTALEQLYYQVHSRIFVNSRQRLVIHHDGDEAISLLKQVVTSKLAPITPAQVRSSFVSLVVPATVIFAIGLTLWFNSLSVDTRPVLFLEYIWENITEAWAGIFQETQLSVVTIPFYALGAALIPLYLIFWLLGSLLSVPLSRGMNSALHAAIRNAATGMSSGFKIKKVGALPELTHVVVPIPDQIARALADDTSLALGSRITELRRLLDIAGDVNADTFKMMNDSFQWNELIHTYYFRHDGFCDFLLEAMGKR
ncbi:triacylglycerol lipase [Parvularcula sp. IMCC14364]|uniref:esterase/lipase family protein n=1 Tax=Parvularcula sp. IMCC14364 TaxID=3067902 RepID=UPI002740A385|nr:hypothetical protein [Parvularcula sp. IMCC14364]